MSNSRKFIAYIEDVLGLIVKPPCMHTVNKGLPFLGYVLFENCIRLNSNSKSRFIQKYNNYSDNLNRLFWAQKEFANHITPLVAFTQYANTQKLRAKVFNEMEICQWAPTV